jgi:hypothetical protein
VIAVDSRRELPIPWKLDSSGMVSAGYTVAKEHLDHISRRFNLDKAKVRLLIDEGRAQMLDRMDEIIHVYPFAISGEGQRGIPR